MATKNQNMFAFRTFCIITGASRGYGQCLAIRFAAQFKAKSVLMLLARDSIGLQETRRLIESNSPSVTVKIKSIDLTLADANSMQQIIMDIFQTLNVTPAQYEQAFIVHNAASLGDVSKLLSGHTDKKELRNYWDLNLTAVILLNSVFFQIFPIGKPKQRVVINLSSICSLQPFKSWSLYCAGKAARDMLFRTMALEEPSIRVLNFAPGPLDTEMQVQARAHTGDEDIRNMFLGLHTEGKLLKCDQSVDKLIQLLEENSFDSGAHIDYYDI